MFITIKKNISRETIELLKRLKSTKISRSTCMYRQFKPLKTRSEKLCLVNDEDERVLFFWISWSLVRFLKICFFFVFQNLSFVKVIVQSTILVEKNNGNHPLDIVPPPQTPLYLWKRTLLSYLLYTYHVQTGFQKDTGERKKKTQVVSCTSVPMCRWILTYQQELFGISCRCENKFWLLRTSDRRCVIYGEALGGPKDRLKNFGKRRT